MNDIKQNMGEFENKQEGANYKSEPSDKKQTTTKSKGDYIDFEEVK